MSKRILSGTVISSSANKTVVVKVTRRVQHKLYKKIINRTKKYHAHDENNTYKIGDSVNIKESSPISKLKSWVVINNSSKENK
jgi:small subunit ribosomal protein S17